MIAEQVIRIDVHNDRVMVRFKSAGTEQESTDGQLLSIPWQKPPSRKSRQILIPIGVPRNEVRPTRIERRARLVNATARGRRWLDEIVSGSVTDVHQIAARQKCSLRQVNVTISLAFLAPGPCQSRGRRSFAPRHWCRATPRRSRGMAPTVRNPRVESTIGSDAARSSHLSRQSPSAGWSVPSRNSVAGTEFLDAETGGQKSTRETLIVGRDRER